MFMTVESSLKSVDAVLQELLDCRSGRSIGFRKQIPGVIACNFFTDSRLDWPRGNREDEVLNGTGSSMLLILTSSASLTPGH
uniref:Uncharacterized protein n=1 Tax=Syphacia muris TaxID=451379 RepID=A0A0N5A9J5_9BILA